MTEKRACPECGVSLPSDAPKGLCPRCLMGAALAATAMHPPTGRVADPGPAAPSPPIDFADFRRAVLELSLLDPEELDRFAAGAAGDVPRLALALVRARKLTSYQAGALVQGKARGLVIGRYLVLDKIGQGGVGVVFKARRRETGRVVALKILPPSFGRDREAVLRFRREFQVASRLSHPNIVAALDADEDRGVHFLTMDYVEGHDLDDLVTAVGPLPIRLALHCTIQAARGLEAAHAAGIIHRDIKPGNLILDAAGAVRVLDLGLARVVEAANPLGRGTGGTLTQTGAYMGTVDYIAPEQADDSKRADQRSDIYSLGCTLYFLLTGRPPFEGETLLKKLMAHQARPAPSLHAARPHISEPLEAAYQAMLAKRPADRPPSMAAVIGQLEACRSSADEARSASVDLQAFARTVMKRAGPKPYRGLDATVFARPSQEQGLHFDPDLRLEDLVMDFREEARVEPLAEEKLPPRPPRSARPRRRRRSAPYGLIALALIGLAAAWYAFQLQAKPDRPGPALPGTVAVVSTAARPAPGPVKPKTATEEFRPLFNGKDLTGWETHPDQPGHWRVENGVLIGSGLERSHLYSERGDYTNFHLRVEARVNDVGNSGVIVRASSRPIWPTDHPILPLGYQAHISSTHKDPYKTGSLYIAGRRFVASFLESSVPPHEWFTMDVIAEGKSLVVKVNGQVTADYVDETREFSSGHIALEQANPETVVEFRRIEIKELNGKGNSPLVAGDGGKPGRGRLVYFDDFNDPRSGWPNESPEQRSRDADDHHGYSDGLYRLDRNVTGYRFWPCPKVAPPEFDCEVVGRVYGDDASGSGSMILHVSGAGHSFQVAIDTAGRLNVYVDDVNPPPKHVVLGARTHPAIKTGPREFNTIVLSMRKGRAEILVNGARVFDPVTLDWEATPADLKLGINCWSPQVRAEFDRFEVREVGAPP